MGLFHYSAEPFTLDRQRRYSQHHDDMKPYGLWLSVEDDTPDSRGWKDWCRDNDFGLDRLHHRTEFVIQPGANVLWVSTGEQLDDFTNKYQYGNRQYRFAFAWPDVASQYGGLVIAPYLYSHRLSLLWYYGWDCASGCIWNCDVLEMVGSEECKEVT